MQLSPFADKTPEEDELTYQKRVAARPKIIGKFRERQRRIREWIGFAEIADWCARRNSGSSANPVSRQTAFRELFAAALRGDFAERGRSCVLDLNALIDRPRRWKQPDDLATINSMYGDKPEILITGYLEHFWIPRALCEAWLKKMREDIPTHFSPKPLDHRPAPAIQTALNAKASSGKKPSARARSYLPYLVKAVIAAVGDGGLERLNTISRADLADRVNSHLSDPKIMPAGTLARLPKHKRVAGRYPTNWLEAIETARQAARSELASSTNSQPV